MLAVGTTAGCGAVVSDGPIAGPAGPSGSPSAIAAEEERRSPFVPATEGQGADVAMPVVFPDGTRATIMYPRQVDLAGMALQPDVTLIWDGRWIGPIVFAYGDPQRSLLAGRSPLAVHDVGGQRVEEWNGRADQDIGYGWHRWLLFRLPRWTVHVPVDHLMETSEVLDAVVPGTTDEGFVIVEVSGPGALAEGYGEAGGPQLSFGDLHPLPDYVRTSDDGILIDVAPSECGDFDPTVQVHGDYASACLGGSLFVNGTSFSGTQESRDVLAEIVKGLGVEEFEPAR
jgi:hypothetical protein